MMLLFFLYGPIVNEADIDFEMGFCEMVTFFGASYRRPRCIISERERL